MDEMFNSIVLFAYIVNSKAVCFILFRISWSISVCIFTNFHAVFKNLLLGEILLGHPPWLKIDPSSENEKYCTILKVALRGTPLKSTDHYATEKNRIQFDARLGWGGDTLTPA